jgi:hypothetical protein
MKLRICSGLVISLIVMASSATAITQRSGTLQSMKLLTAQAGWAATGQRLFWTTNGGGHWRDITPHTVRSEEIASVFFLDKSRGWVLLSSYDEIKDAPQFDFAATTDAGDTWSVTHFAPPINLKQYILAGDGRIDFVDSLHGWMNFIPVLIRRLRTFPH